MAPGNDDLIVFQIRLVIAGGAASLLSVVLTWLAWTSSSRMIVDT